MLNKIPFHQTVKTWFSNTFSEPTEAQFRVWSTDHENLLIAAPTGSGKTLAAFLSSINRLIERSLVSSLPDQISIVYISPLKALSNDVEKNLQIPLRGIEQEIKRQNIVVSPITVALRTSDSSPNERRKMVKKPPHILITTPESFYLLLTSNSGRLALSSTETVIVDELHALVGNKRGAHLSLSLERLRKVTGRDFQRIGISATQKPIEDIASFLTGVRRVPSRSCHIINTGHRRFMDLSIEVPRSPLGSIMDGDTWREVHKKLSELIEKHHTTLIFVNTRRLSERLSRKLREMVGEEKIASHHGSMSREQRMTAEEQLKKGQLKALVATASLELGIDIGSIDLVCQIGSPRSISVFLQRAGRSGHQVHAIPQAILFPETRDDLIECASLLDATRRGELDAIVMPDAPVDILAQQIVAEISCQDYTEEQLFDLYSHAYSYRNLSKETFEEVLEMLHDGFTFKTGRRNAYIQRDPSNGNITTRKGSQLTALTCGGAIPDSFQFDVILEPTGNLIGSLDEDFALESLPGDIFQLGNDTWQILKIQNGKVRVAPVKGQAPTIPFWIGEAPGRTKELSYAVSRFRREIISRLFDNNVDQLSSHFELASDWLNREVGIANKVAIEQIIEYLSLAFHALGDIPTQEHIIAERFFDETGDMHLVFHSPFGIRVNRAWGLAIRKRFCRNFNFELQAAALEDSIILSLGETHSFHVEQAFTFLRSETVEEVLIQALLDTPMFEIRWRWNTSRSFAIKRNRAGQKTPPQIQRMNAEDLIALVFPDQLACLENVVGEREIPEHPLVQQTIKDCLTEAMDIDAFTELLCSIEKGTCRVSAKDMNEPSVMSQGIINAKPFAYLDPAPFEERRTLAIKQRRNTDAAIAQNSSEIDPESIEKTRQEMRPNNIEGKKDLRDALISMVYFTHEDIQNIPEINQTKLLAKLSEDSHATKIYIDKNCLWIAADYIPHFQILYATAQKKIEWQPGIRVRSSLTSKITTADQALLEIIRNRLSIMSPLTATELGKDLALSQNKIISALFELERQGYAFQGRYMAGVQENQWCERYFLYRINRYSRDKRRANIRPVTTIEFLRFLFTWQGLSTAEKREEYTGLFSIIEQLQLFETNAAAWESDILPSRMKKYNSEWSNQVCLSGQYVWGKLGPRDSKKGALGSAHLSIAFSKRLEFPNWLKLNPEEAGSENFLSAPAKRIFQTLQQRGALFFDDLLNQTKMLPTQIEQGLVELSGKGVVSCDTYKGLKSILMPESKRSSAFKRRGKSMRGMADAGRWFLLREQKKNTEERDVIITQYAKILLKRYGVVFRKILTREKLAPSWRELLMVLRKMELGGEVRKGYFVEGQSGEQFAHLEAVEKLKKFRKRCGNDEELVVVNGCDPLNLVGILTPGERIPTQKNNRILFRNGEPILVLRAGLVRILGTFEPKERAFYERILQRNSSPSESLAQMRKIEG